MKEKNLLIPALICLIIGTIIISVAYAEPTITINEPLNISIYFCPKDNCKDILINTINNSKTIKCAFYDLDFKLPERSLLITDKKNKINNSVTNKGYQLMHNKFCILDDTIITGSMNPTIRGTELNNNNLVIIKSKELMENYLQEFKEMYSGTYGKGDKTKHTKFIFTNTTIENYFCPEDLCVNKIIRHLENAKESIYFMTFSFTHKQIADTLIKKHKQGLKIQGIIETTQQVKGNKFNSLKSNNVSVIYDLNKYKMHHKVFIIDDKTVILGSMNPTLAGDTKNDENILIIQNKEIANKFIQEFIDLNLT